MRVQTNDKTIEAIKEVMAKQEDQAKNIRIYIAGMGCSGPSFGMTLDEATEGDLIDDTQEVSFILSKEIHDKMGDMVVELTEGGYLVRPVNPPESACGSCGGGCS